MKGSKLTKRRGVIHVVQAIMGIAAHFDADSSISEIFPAVVPDLLLPNSIPSLVLEAADDAKSLLPRVDPDSPVFVAEGAVVSIQQLGQDDAVTV